MRSRRGDEALDLAALYRSSRDDVYGYVAALLRDRAAAEEATAAAFERAFRRRGSHSAGRGSPRAWLFGIARNAAYDELRRLRRTAPAEQAGEPPRESDDPTADAALRRVALGRALAQLEPEERELVALRFEAGLPHAEVAAILGITESNAGTRLARAMVKLRRAME